MPGFIAPRGSKPSKSARKVKIPGLKQGGSRKGMTAKATRAGGKNTSRPSDG
jgi:hypothetical protein